MPVDLWLAFAAASAVMLLIPGPTSLLVVSYALGHGARSAAATAAGVVAGDFVAMTLSLIGVGALLATSAELFTLLKWVGAGYLVWLGIKLWRTEPAMEANLSINHGRIFAHAFIVTTLNPKSIVFFVAFLPQFVDPSLPFLPQTIVLETTFLVLSATNALTYAFAASSARKAVRRPSVLRVINRLGGSLLIGAGLAAAFVKRST